MAGKVVLEPRETMAQHRERVRLAVDAENLIRAVRSNPGLPSKSAIATKTGLTPSRVALVIRKLNDGEIGSGVRCIEFGRCKPTGGPYAGQEVWGWFAMNVKRHHHVMDAADEREAKVVDGVQQSRRNRLVQAHGMANVDPAIPERIAKRMGVKAKDIDVFVEQLSLIDEDREAA